MTGTRGDATAEAVRILRGVAELFSAPGTWTPGAWAKDAQGMHLGRPLDDRAVSWCLFGAVRKVRGPGMSPAEDLAIGAVHEALGLRDGETIAAWEDAPGRTVDDVRHAVTAAAEILEGKS
jgi:hypothetical protein